MSATRPRATHPCSARTAAVLVRGEEAYEAVTTALSGADGLTGRVRLGRLAGADDPWLDDGAADVLILDVDMADPGELAALTGVIERFRNRVPVLVTARQPTMEGMRALLRLGIADLIPQPIRRADLLAAVADALAAVRGAQ
ncbi:MAG TPA: hypothetical protein VGE72_14285, partial [Azospirillum sp.]